MTYINEYPIYAEEVVYEGEHDPNEVICEIKWCVADLLDMMAHLNIELTDENIDCILKQWFARVLTDRSIEEGWEIIETLLSCCTDGLTYEKKGE